MNNPESTSAPSESITVNIFDQTYRLRSRKGGEHVQRVAALVDERMRQISSHATAHDILRVAVLAALNIADELESLKDHYEKEIEALVPRSSSGSREEVEQAPHDDNIRPPEGDAGQSWFEAIFDSESPAKEREERLSSQVSARLQSIRQAGGREAPTVEAHGDDEGG